MTGGTLFGELPDREDDSREETENGNLFKCLGISSANFLSSQRDYLTKSKVDIRHYLPIYQSFALFNGCGRLDASLKIFDIFIGTLYYLQKNNTAFSCEIVRTIFCAGSLF